MQSLDPAIRSIVAQDKALQKELSSGRKKTRKKIQQQKAKERRDRERSISLVDINRSVRLARSGKSASTIRDQSTSYKTFIRWVSKKYSRKEQLNVCFRYLFSLDAGAAHELITKYRSFLLEAKNKKGGNYSRGTINLRVSHVCGVVKAGYKLGVCPFLLSIKSLPYCSEDFPQHFPEKNKVQQTIRYLSERKEGDFEYYRDYLIYMIAWTLALRADEIATLRYSKEDMARGQIGILNKDRGKKRIKLSIPAGLVSEIREFNRIRSKRSGALFYDAKYQKSYYSQIPQKYFSNWQITQIMKKRAEEAGAYSAEDNPLTCHGIRRSSVSEVATKAQEMGHRLEEVLEFSRHRDIRTLQVYLKRSGKAQGKFSSLAHSEILKMEDAR